MQQIYSAEYSSTIEINKQRITKRNKWFEINIFTNLYFLSNKFASIDSFFLFSLGREKQEKKKNVEAIREIQDWNNPIAKQFLRSGWALNKRFQKEFRRENSSSNTGFPPSLSLQTFLRRFEGKING